jgi:hypothetical protein
MKYFPFFKPRKVWLHARKVKLFLGIVRQTQAPFAKFFKEKPHAFLDFPSPVRYLGGNTSRAPSQRV